MIKELDSPHGFAHEINKPAFDTSRLRDRENPLPNDDPSLKDWVVENGELYINRAVIGVRPAVPGELVETWVSGPEGEKVLERSVVAEEGQLVAVGALGEKYIPSAAGLERNKVPVGEEGLREDEVVPPLPDDGHHYELWRPNGDDYRVVATNPYDGSIYLRTSSGRLQVGVPDGKIAAQVSARPGAEGMSIDSAVDVGVARFIAPNEFAVSYRPVAKRT